MSADRPTWPSGQPKLFSGPASKELWGLINNLSQREEWAVARTVHDVLYMMGCRLQELEAEVERLRQARLDEKVERIQDGGPAC